MQYTHVEGFIKEFYNFNEPKPKQTEFTETQLKNNDMKISLEIATRSFLRMQSDPKSNFVSFSCKNYGKSCYEIFAFKKGSVYVVDTDYKMIKHFKECELSKESFEYLKIYNLMKLKKDFIQQFMEINLLMSNSPSEILAFVSKDSGYFFEERINYNPEMRRKLRKRFDNIINIDIKKITKGGRALQQINFHELFEERQNKIKMSSANLKKENSKNQKDKINDIQNYEPFYRSITKKQSQNYQKSKSIKKLTKQKKNIEQLKRFFILHHNQNENKVKQLDEQIFVNPQSQCQLKQIKQLKAQFNAFEDIFSWGNGGGDNENVEIQPKIIHDRLKESFYLSIKNSLSKRSPSTQSISNFSEGIGFRDFDDDII